MMNQFSFDLDSYEMPGSVEVTGCIQAQNLYYVSSKDAEIQVLFENLNESFLVRLDIADHPAALNMVGEVPVSLTLSQNPNNQSYTGHNLKVLNDYKSFEHLPFKYIPEREVLTNTQEWIDSCPYESLKTFIYRVLGDPSIGGLFFSIPASTHRHYSQLGGLAKHSLEVAQIVHSATTCFEEHERWLAAAAGLLHEVGRVRMSIDDSTLKATAGLVCCEVLNFEVLGPALQLFEKEWADGAEVVRYMLDSLYRPRKSGPNLPITLSLRSADLMSMANNQRNLAFKGKSKSEVFAQIGNSVGDLFWQPSAP